MFSWHTSELEPDALEAQLSAHNAKHLEIALAIVADLLSSCALGLALTLSSRGKRMSQQLGNDSKLDNA